METLQTTFVSKDEKIKLSKEDEKAIEKIIELGIPAKLARTLLYISHTEEERFKGVKPEVSAAMQELRKREWVKKRDLKMKGKGRPVHVYKPSKDISEALKALEQEKFEKIENIKNDMDKLNKIIEGQRSDTKRKKILKNGGNKGGEKESKKGFRYYLSKL